MTDKDKDYISCGRSSCRVTWSVEEDGLGSSVHLLVLALARTRNKIGKDVKLIVVLLPSRALTLAEDIKLELFSFSFFSASQRTREYTSGQAWITSRSSVS